MIKSKFHKIAIVLSSLAVLSGGLGIDTAHARDGGFPYERSGTRAPKQPSKPPHGIVHRIPRRSQRPQIMPETGKRQRVHPLAMCLQVAAKNSRSSLCEFETDQAFREGRLWLIRG